MASPGLTNQLKASCTVCASPNRAQINLELNKGWSQRGIAKRHDVSKDAVRRHFQSRHPGVQGQDDRALLPGGDDFDPNAGEGEGAELTPRQKLQALISALEKQKVGGALRVDVARELRIAYTELDKMQGGARPQAESYRELDGWAELEALIFSALAPFPEARKALALAMGAPQDPEEDEA